MQRSVTALSLQPMLAALHLQIGYMNCLFRGTYCKLEQSILHPKTGFHLTAIAALSTSLTSISPKTCYENPYNAVFTPPCRSSMSCRITYREVSSLFNYYENVERQFP